MLIFFDATNGIQPGPFTLPSTGPAYEQVDRKSSPFYLEGSANKAGTAYFVSALAPDLSTVRIARYAANFIPRNMPAIAAVDDVNGNVGFWLPQPDFRIPERISPGFGPFPDLELETMYRDQVRSFTDYQTRVALRAIRQNPEADLVMTYFEQPDGSGHQFLLIDPRQPTDFTNPASIFEGQDSAKVSRYRNYLKEAYQAANQAVQAIIDAVGTDEHGELNSNIFVVSDHGFAPFHTAVNINNLLANNGIDPTQVQVRAVTSGPAANIYIGLAGREPDGTVSQAEYIVLQQQVVEILKNFFDTNPLYTLGSRQGAGVRQGPHPSSRPPRSRLRQEHQRIHRPGFGRCLRSAFVRLQLRWHAKPCGHPTRRSSFHNADPLGSQLLWGPWLRPAHCRA